MSRSFRFVRYDAALTLLDEVSLTCIDGADALTVGWTLGWRVEVWDGARPLGVVGEGALMTAASGAAEPSVPIAAIPDSDSQGPVSAEPIDEREAIPFDETRAYNPFRKGTWRRRAAP